MSARPKYIFVVGGVMSGVGKGIASSSIGKLLSARGLEVTALKVDPYVNVDAGTMNPTEHGEVFVLDDGTECDQDMGNYERFLNRSFSRTNYMTTGSVYLSVIQKERKMRFGGKTVEVVPHIPMEVISKINKAIKNAGADVAITEIGGTVGEYQNILFLEAIRMLKRQFPRDVALVLVSFLPQVGGTDGELKTKPTQRAVRDLNAVGLQPDIIIARAKTPLDAKRKEKIAFHCNLHKQDVISAPDVSNIYEVPLNFEADKLSQRIISKLGLRGRPADLEEWADFVKKSNSSSRSVRIAVVGKYFGSGGFVIEDAYISVIEALKHAAYSLNLRPELTWMNSEEFEKKPGKLKELKDFDGILIPGGFGARGVEGKIRVIQFARENKLPLLGLCYGMQLIVIEAARHLAGLKNANTTEVDPGTPYPVIDILPEQKQVLIKKRYGGTMRLGAFPAFLKRGSVARRAYGLDRIDERHRHRYEVNPAFVTEIEKSGLVFSGRSEDGYLAEIAELPASVHPFFLGTQFHPEFKSRPLAPHPLFISFIQNSHDQSLGLSRRNAKA